MDRPILILGVDGYTGWSLACHLLEHDYDVYGVDNYLRRREAGRSVTPITSLKQRSKTANDAFDGHFRYTRSNIADQPARLQEIIDTLAPRAIVNLAQIPSAPFSMASVENAWLTQQNNIQGALNLMWALRDLDREGTHVVQLATMGEYPVGTGIPEGFLEDGRPAPKSPGSLYHASKCNATINTYFCSETWGIPVSEVYQGIVYGLPAAPRDALLTRFDVDAMWGTVLNRFTAQAAVDEPLTVYGRGGQKRAMLPIDDCVRCLRLAIENPPGPGVPGRAPYRAINQFQESHRVRELAEMVQSFTGVDIEHIPNPRVEDDSDHFYDPERTVLDDLGYEPSATIEDVFRRTFNMVEEFTDRIDVDDLRPHVYWSKATTAPADD